VEGRKKGVDLLRTRWYVYAIQYFPLVERKQTEQRRSGDAILAFSGRQTMTRSRSAEDKEAKRCYTFL
jgi:hypothetical protein